MNWEESRSERKNRAQIRKSLESSGFRELLSARLLALLTGPLMDNFVSKA